MNTWWRQFFLRTCATAVFIGSVWVVLGSVWFPEWWYPVIWNGSLLDSDYLSSGWSGDPFNERWFWIGICLALLLLVLSYLFWAGFRNWVDRWAVGIIKVCLSGLIVDALLLYVTQAGWPPLLQTLFVGSIFGVLALWRLPLWQVAHSRGLTYRNRFNRENEARKTVAQILGGFFVLMGLYSSLESLNLSREGQITDRFTKAIEQLGAVDGKSNPKLEVRLGGIYALERISRDSERDYSVVMEILTTYVREYSPVMKQDGQKGNQHQPSNLQHPSVDVQAILTVLGRREIKLPPTFFDLSSTNLAGVNLSQTNGLIGANLSGSNLSGGNLEGADLGSSNLSNSNLSGAHLRRARLMGANISGANLRAADFKGADCYAADFRSATVGDADFTSTNLTGASFGEWTDLTGAKLTGANLGQADLRGAMITQTQINSARGDRWTQLPKGLTKPDTWLK